MGTQVTELSSFGGILLIAIITVALAVLLGGWLG